MAQIISGIKSALRPMAKELIKGSLVAIDAVSGLVAETGEQIKDLVAEAKAELVHEAKPDAPKDDTTQSGNGVRH